MLDCPPVTVTVLPCAATVTAPRQLLTRVTVGPLEESTMISNSVPRTSTVVLFGASISKLDPRDRATTLLHTLPFDWSSW